jgi:glycosyltransferase involved in cell wall biosynthesis
MLEPGCPPIGAAARKRIALVAPGGVDPSGEYRVIPALIALIARLSQRHDVHVITLHQEPSASQWQLAGATIWNIGAPRTGLRALGALIKLHRSVGFDVIHSIFSGLGGSIAVTGGKLLRVPSLIHVGGGELVSIPEIAYGGAQRWRGRLRESLNLRGANVVTAASSPIIEMIAEHGISARRVPLGVDLDAWPVRKPMPRHRDRPARLIHVASLNRVKDQTTLLRAMALLKQSGQRFEMRIVGGDTLGGEMEAMTTRLGIDDCVRFLGFLTQRQLRPEIEASDLMVLASRHETGPLVLLEAAVIGVPTVGTSVGHLREWAPKAALCVPTGDHAGLAAAITTVLNDENLRIELALHAQDRAVREDANHTAACFETLYEELTSLRGRRR